jgi:hypothetical protein
LAKPRASGFSCRNSRVQKFKNGFELLRPRGKKILELLGAGNKASDAAKVIGCGKSSVSYWKNELLRIGALRLQCHDVYDVFSLTPFGSKLLTGSEGVRREVVLLEDHAMKFVVVEGEKVRLDWVKLGEPRNWVKLGLRVGGVRVVKNAGRSLVIHPGRLRGFGVDELLVESGRVVERVKVVLENRFGMVLSTEGVALHKPIFRFYSREAKDLAEAGTTIVEGVGSIDVSPPEKIPHEEYQGRDLAKERLLMPFRIHRLEGKVDSLATQIHELASALRELTQPQSLQDMRSKDDLSYIQ